MYECMYVRMYVSSERPITTSNKVCTALMASVHEHNPKNCVGLSSKINNQRYYYLNVTYLWQ